MPDSVSIIIPTLNEASNVATCIERAWQAGADEVIVADGGSTDGTREKLESLTCQWLSSSTGRGHQLDAGAQASTGDWLLFLHADNWLVQDGCDQIRQRSNDPGFDYGGFRQRIQASPQVYRWLETGNALRLKWRGLIYGDQAFFIRKRIFETVGGFPAIPIMEDIAISRKLKTHSNARLLPGPTFVSARRWEKNGVLKQTLKNWYLSTRFLLGASPEQLALEYRK